MAQFNKLEDTNISYKGRHVKYIGRQRKVADMNGKVFNLPTGAYGYCYSVNGATMYLAFKENLLLPPIKSSTFANWNYHISIRPLVDSNWEIEKV